MRTNADSETAGTPIVVEDVTTSDPVSCTRYPRGASFP